MPLNQFTTNDSFPNPRSQVQKAEPISAHPDKLREQIEENRLMLEDLEKRKDAVEHVKAAAEELIAKGILLFWYLLRFCQLNRS